MSFEQMLKDKIAKAPFRSREKEMLRLVLGEVQQKANITEEQGYTIIKNIITGIDKNLGYLTPDDLRRAQYDEEKDILSSLLPIYLKSDEILAKLKELNLEESIKTAPKEGPATGIAINAFKKLSLPVEGETVKEVVKTIRENQAKQ